MMHPSPLNAIAVIPARGGSKRLPRKNLTPVLGLPLIAWSIRAALGSRYLGAGQVYVSTDDAEIAETALAHGALVIERSSQLAQDHVTTEPVIRHAVETIEARGSAADYVVWMNACAPEVVPGDIDAAFDRLLEGSLREVFSVDTNLRSTSIVRVLQRAALFQNQLSYKCGVFILDYVDIHYAADVAAAEERLRRRLAEGGG